VAKGSAKVFAIFVPADLVLTNGEIEKYWDDLLKVMSESERPAWNEGIADHVKEL